jgi:DNA-binding GntR family transcriptional regulator
MTTDVYKQIRGAILEGRFEGGRLLSENALATQFGTSRTPVREALHRLEIERLVERGPRGTAVRAPSPDEILDIYEVRVTLEASAARAAALRATALDIVQLRNSQEHMRAVTDPADRPTTNRAFHRVVWQASHSPTLDDLLRRLHVHLQRYPTTTLDWGNRWDQVLEEHDSLIDAIVRRDADAAYRIAEEHMAKARDIRLRMYGEAP